MRFGGLALLAVVACTPPPVEGPVAVRDGLSVAVYTSLVGPGGGFAVVDDRRVIEVTGDSIIIERVAPGATLSSLIVEPLGDSSLRIGECSREALALPPPAEADADGEVAAGSDAYLLPVRQPPIAEEIVIPGRVPVEGRPRDSEPTPSLSPVVDSPIVRCTVVSGRGTHRVRILYVTPDVTFTAHHDIAMSTPEAATVTTRFALPTPDLDMRGEVTLYAGMPGPGRDETPVEVGRGEVTLDGSISLFGGPTREVRARLRRMWRSADASTANEDAYRAQQVRPVRVWLELEGPLQSGDATLRVDLPYEPPMPQSIPAEAIERGANVTRMPVRDDADLISLHESRPLRARDEAARERFSISISNAGPVAREVVVVYALTKGKAHTVESSWPVAPTIERDLAKSKVQIEANSVGRLRYIVSTTN